MYTLRGLTAGILVVVLVIGASADDKKEKPDDAERLQGKWEVVSVESQGKAIENDRAVGSILTFNGAKIAIDTKTKGRDEHKASFTLKTDESPKQIDWKTDRDKYRSSLGIYELDGDMLKICLSDIPGRPRPTKFSTEKEKDYVLLIMLKRVKK